jgi:hypothetical protein
MSVLVLWVVRPCGFEDRYQLFGGTLISIYRLLPQEFRSNVGNHLQYIFIEIFIQHTYFRL